MAIPLAVLSALITSLPLLSIDALALVIASMAVTTSPTVSTLVAPRFAIFSVSTTAPVVRLITTMSTAPVPETRSPDANVCEPVRLFGGGDAVPSLCAALSCTVSFWTSVSSSDCRFGSTVSRRSMRPFRRPVVISPVISLVPLLVSGVPRKMPVIPPGYSESVGAR